MRWIRTFAIICVMTMLGVTTAFASLTVRLALPELADASVAIVRGKVVAIDSAWDRRAGAIYSYVVIRVDETLKGDVPRRITLKQLGGTVDDMTLTIHGQAEFTRGEEVLLFLGLRERDMTVHTSTLWQGKWTVRRDLDASVPLAARQMGRDDQGEIIGRERVPLAELEAVARLRSAASRAVPAGVVFDPPDAPRPGSTLQRAGEGPRQRNLGFSWHEAFSGGQIPVSFTDRVQPGTFIGNGKGAVKIAWHFWDGVPHAINIFTNGGEYTGTADGTEIRGGSCSADIAVFNQDPNGEIDNAGGVIAFGGAYSTSSTIRGLNKACNGFIVGNDSEVANRYMDNFVCYENILKHEMGHVAGLAHVGDQKALMYASLTEGRCNWPFFLHAEERDAFRAIYDSGYRD